MGIIGIKTTCYAKLNIGGWLKKIVVESVDGTFSPSTCRHLRKVKQPRREEDASQGKILGTPPPGLMNGSAPPVLEGNISSLSTYLLKIGKNTKSKLLNT